MADEVRLMLVVPEWTRAPWFTLFRRLVERQCLYATSSTSNHLPPMESFHFRTRELGPAQYRTCFESLDTQLELISYFPERVLEYLKSH